MRTYKLKCGCVAEKGRERWVSLCPPHQAEADECHKANAEWSQKRAAERAAQEESV